jgi:hypothetical protein
MRDNLMAAKKKATVEPRHVEDLKTRHGFDHHLARAIVPLGRRRRMLQHPVLSDQIVDAIRDTIDGPLTIFIAGGATKVPVGIYANKPKHRRKFSPRQELTNLLRRFVARCFADLHGRELTRAEQRRYAVRARVLIVAVIERSSRLAEYVTR